MPLQQAKELLLFFYKNPADVLFMKDVTSHFSKDDVCRAIDEVVEIEDRYVCALGVRFHIVVVGIQPKGHNTRHVKLRTNIILGHI